MNRSHTMLFGAALLTAFAVGTLPGCSEDDKSTPPETQFDAGPLLETAAVHVIFATYADLDARAEDLGGAVGTLADNKNEANLAAAREAWREARTPWEQSESFLFGPVATQGIDPSIDSWPVNVNDLEAVLSSGSVLTREFVDGLEGTLKGFHTIEYLLFGESGAREASTLTPRELEYLEAVTASFAGATHQLAVAWSPSGGNYVAQLADAGETGSVYVSQKAGVQVLVTGMISIADEVANGKINDPYSARDPVLEESRFSANSLADFADNIRSLQNLYLGQYGGHADEGVASLVAHFDPALDGRLRAEIEAAIEGINQVPPPFSQAIFTNGTAIEAAQEKVRRVQQTLEEDVASLLERM